MARTPPAGPLPATTPASCCTGRCTNSAPESRSADDGLILRDCRITNAVRCLPPANKPATSEVDRCNDYLVEELAQPAPPRLVLALGGIAHRAVLRARGLKLSSHRFAHAAQHALGDGLELVDSYHCSRYNTQTGRLTAGMFRELFAALRRRLDALPHD